MTDGRNQHMQITGERNEHMQMIILKKGNLAGCLPVRRDGAFGGPVLRPGFDTRQM